LSTADEVPHPYSIEVSPLVRPDGHFRWAIRRSGKLIERSDRPYRSEAEAYERALEAIQREMKPGSDFRGR
jgi:hypothetical protein